MLKKLLGLSPRLFFHILMSAVMRELNVVMLPNVRQTEKRLGYRYGVEPNKHIVEHEMLKHGVRCRELDLNRSPWNPLASKGSFYAGFDFLRALKVLVTCRKADVIVSVFESNVFFVLLLRRLFRFSPKIVLWEVPASGWRKRDWVVEFVANRVDRVLVLTQAQKMAIEARCPLRHPAEVVGFSIDEDFFAPTEVHGANTDDGYILAVGDDVGRDYETLIQAVTDSKHQLKIRSNVKFNVPSGAQERIEVVPRLSFERLKALYAGAAVVVVPLHDMDHASGITSIFEAMAMGKAVIASDVGTSRDYVIHGQNGWLTPVGDVRAMTAAIDELMSSSELRRRLGQRARADMEAHLSYRAYARRFAECLHSAAQAS